MRQVSQDIELIFVIISIVRSNSCTIALTFMPLSGDRVMYELRSRNSHGLLEGTLTLHCRHAGGVHSLSPPYSVMEFAVAHFKFRP